MRPIIVMMSSLIDRYDLGQGYLFLLRYFDAYQPSMLSKPMETATT